MPTYEFACLRCEGVTTYSLNDGEALDFTQARCEWCTSKRIRLQEYHCDTSTLVAALQGQVAALEARIDALENPDENNEDWEVSN